MFNITTNVMPFKYMLGTIHRLFIGCQLNNQTRPRTQLSSFRLSNDCELCVIFSRAQIYLLKFRTIRIKKQEHNSRGMLRKPLILQENRVILGSLYSSEDSINPV